VLLPEDVSQLPKHVGLKVMCVYILYALYMQVVVFLIVKSYFYIWTIPFILMNFLPKAYKLP